MSKTYHLQESFICICNKTIDIGKVNAQSIGFKEPPEASLALTQSRKCLMGLLFELPTLGDIARYNHSTTDLPTTIMDRSTTHIHIESLSIWHGNTYIDR